jgi:hypothetical protein
LIKRKIKKGRLDSKAASPLEVGRWVFPRHLPFVRVEEEERINGRELSFLVMDRSSQ